MLAGSGSAAVLSKWFRGTFAATASTPALRSDLEEEQQTSDGQRLRRFHRLGASALQNRHRIGTE